MVRALAIVTIGGIMACSSWADHARQAISVGHLASREAITQGMARLESRCAELAETCGRSADRVCTPLAECHQRGDSIITAYGASNAAMAMAILAITAAELAERTARVARDPPTRAKLRAEAETLVSEAQKQLAHAQRESRRVIDALQREGVL